jgi:hypothetical protein
MATGGAGADGVERTLFGGDPRVGLIESPFDVLRRDGDHAVGVTDDEVAGPDDDASGARRLAHSVRSEVSPRPASVPRPSLRRCPRESPAVSLRPGRLAWRGMALAPHPRRVITGHPAEVENRAGSSPG